MQINKTKTKRRRKRRIKKTRIRMRINLKCFKSLNLQICRFHNKLGPRPSIVTKTEQSKSVQKNRKNRGRKSKLCRD